MRRTSMYPILPLWIGLFGLSGVIHAAILPDFLLRPVALHYCQAKTAPFTSPADRRSLCRCAWNQIIQTPGERSAILQEALHSGGTASGRAHWLAVEHRQILSCVAQDHLTGTLRQVELKNPKLAEWMQKP